MIWNSTKVHIWVLLKCNCLRTTDFINVCSVVRKVGTKINAVLTSRSRWAVLKIQYRVIDFRMTRVQWTLTALSIVYFCSLTCTYDFVCLYGIANPFWTSLINFPRDQLPSMSLSFCWQQQLNGQFLLPRMICLRISDPRHIFTINMMWYGIQLRYIMLLRFLYHQIPWV